MRSTVATSTTFGGIFYLLNAALALHLYADFTAPRGHNLALSPWDLLALAGRAWFGVEFTRDPVWALLAELAGRDAGDEPGSDFDQPAEWAVDGEWLVPWGVADRLSYTTTRSRLAVWHPAGFLVCVADRDRNRAPREQAAALCACSEALRGAGVAPGRCSAPLPRGAGARWLAALLLFLRARLVAALGDDTAPAEVPAQVCRHAARIEAGAERIDVHLSLADLPLSIRCAGLDRDAGWIPAAGRALYFHFG